jgi:hypothetical protein
LETAGKLGLKYSKGIYPRVLNLAKVTKAELKGFFGRWPLPTQLIINKPLMKLSEGDAHVLARLREKSGVGRDSLPYTDAFESICREFEGIKGQIVDRHTTWMAIGRVEKKGKKETES